jgi:hypothetical protein
MNHRETPGMYYYAVIIAVFILFAGFLLLLKISG